jgi:hypothetical protein
MKLKRIIAGSILASCISCSAAPQENSIVQAYRSLLDAMGEPQLSRADHFGAFWMLEHGGKDLIPLLIDHLEDKRVFDPEAEPPGAPADGSVHVAQTVGSACEMILYRILLPRNAREKFTVENWKQWWAERSMKSLGELREEAAEKNLVGASKSK